MEKDFSLDIGPVPTKKTGIQQRLLMKEGVIPKHAEISIFAGPAGSGKTTLVNNLLLKPHFYGVSWEGVRIPKSKDIESGRVVKKPKPKKYFDYIVLLMGSADDMYDDLIADGIIDQVILNPKISDIKNIIDAQEALFKDNGGDIMKVPKLLIIGDDIISKKRLLNSDEFSDLSIKNRHLNASIWFLAQYINMVPKKIREQASHIFVFQCSSQCVKVLGEMFKDHKTTTDEFLNLIDIATEVEASGKRNFLYINKKAKIRFRKNLDKYLILPWQAKDYTNQQLVGDESLTRAMGKKEVKQHLKEMAAEEVEERSSEAKKPEPVIEQTPQSHRQPIIETKKPKWYRHPGRMLRHF